MIFNLLFAYNLRNFHYWNEYEKTFYGKDFLTRPCVSLVRSDGGDGNDFGEWVTAEMAMILGNGKSIPQPHPMASFNQISTYDKA